MAASMRIPFGRAEWCMMRLCRVTLHLERGLCTLPGARGKQQQQLLEPDPRAVERVGEAAKAHKQHPGKVRIRKVTVPQRLEAAIALLLDRFPVADLEKKCQQLNKHIRARHPPISDPDLRLMARQFEEVAKDRDGRNPDELDLEESQKYEKKIRKEVFAELKKKVYHWQPLKFDESSSVLYAAARMAQNYGILTQCLSEINQQDPEFVPRSMYNLGSGAGSAIWAAHGLWRERLFEYYCVDPSPDMNTIARLLLQDVDDQKSMHIREVFFRQFTPSPLQNNFDLVVCSHTLMEMATQKDRLSAVLDMWRMTNNYLLLVEVGTGAGFKLINEARDYILQLEDPDLEGHVFAPCPHDQACPKLVERNSPCFFQVNYGPLQIFNMKETRVTDTYSYVVLKKGKRPDSVTWPRVIQDVLVRKKHIHCHLCCPNSSLLHAVFTARKHGRDVYRFARYSQWGDLLPVVLPPAFPQSQQAQPAPEVALETTRETVEETATETVKETVMDTAVETSSETAGKSASDTAVNTPTTSFPQDTK